MITCNDCKHQRKAFHEDKRCKEGGYWLYQCDLNSDSFENHAVDGYPDEYCSSAERKEE